MADRRQVEKQQAGVVSASRRMTEYEGAAGGSGIIAPKGVPIWVPKKAGEYRISVCPFRLTDKIKRFIPKKTRFGDPGGLYYEQTYHNHRGVGPNNQTVICTACTFNKPCSVCEFRVKAFSDPDRDTDMEKLLKDLKNKERQLWLIFDHDDEKKGLQLFDVSFYLFGENLFNKIGRIKDPKKKARADQFADPKRGCMLVLGAEEKSMGKGNPFLEFADIQFEDREEPVPKEVLQKALETDLSACIPMPDYKELKKIFTTGLGGGKKKDDEDTEEEETDDEEAGDEGDSDEGDEEGDDGDGAGDGDEDGAEDEEDDDEAGDGEEAGEDEDKGTEVTPKYKKGQTVLFKSSKGKKLTGKIIAVKADADEPFYRIQVEDYERPFNVPYDDVLKAAEPAKDDEDDDEPPAKKPKGKKGKPKDEFEDDEFEQTFGGGDDEEEEEEKPKKGKKKSKKQEDDEDDDSDPF